MDSVVPVQNENFSGDGEEFTEISRAVREAESYLHRKFVGIWQILWRSFMVSSYFHTSSIWDDWDCRKSSAQSKGRNVCSIVAMDEIWWSGSMDCYCYLRNVQDLVADGRTPCERRFGGPFLGPFRSEQWLKVFRFLHTTSHGSTNLVRKACQEYFSDTLWLRERISKGDIFGCRHWGAGKIGRVRNLRWKGPNAKEITSKKKWIFHIPSRRRHGQIAPRINSEAVWSCWEWRSQRRTSKKLRWVSTSRNQRGRWSPQWLLVGWRKLHLSSSCWTSSSALCAKRGIIPNTTEVYWRDQENSHTTIIGILMRIELCQIRGQDSRSALNERQDICCPGGAWRRSKQQPEIWIGMAKAAKKQEKQEWAIEKPKLDNARKLRGVYFIDPEDEEHKETIKNARKKLETPLSVVIPCKMGTRKRFSRSCGKLQRVETLSHTSKHACIVEAHESTGKRLESTLQRNHDDRIAEKGFNSLTHYNLVPKFITMSQAMNISDAKAAVNKEWEKLEKILAWQMDKVRSKKDGILGAQNEKKKVHFATLMDICHLETAGFGPQPQKIYRGRVVLRGDAVKDDFGAHAVFTEQGSPASQMTAATVTDVIASLPGCAGQAADAVSAYTRVKMEDAPRLIKIPKSERPDVWIRLPRHKWPKSWSDIEDQVVPPERNLYGHPLACLLWERQIEEVLATGMGRSSELGMSFCSPKTRIVLVGKRGWH